MWWIPVAAVLTGASWSPRCRLGPEPHLELAEVVAAQEADEGGGRLGDAAVDDVLLVLDAAGAHPLAQLVQRRAVARVEVPHDETARGGSLADKGAHPARARVGGVVLGDGAA